MTNCTHKHARFDYPIFERRFTWRTDEHAGFSFPADSAGTIQLQQLTKLAADNAHKCLAGELDVIDRGTTEMTRRVDETWIEYDARGIPLGRVCAECVEQHLAKFRPEVLTDPNYDHDEPLEPDQ